MAKIQTYESPKVQGQTAEAARLNPGIAQNNLGVLGEGLGNMAHGLDQIQFEEDKFAASTRLTNFLEEQGKVTAGLKSMTGQAAIQPDKDGKTPTDLAMERINGLKAQFKDGLGFRASRVFDAMADPHVTHFRAQAREHQRVQHEAAVDQDAAAKDAIAVKMVADDPIKQRATNEAVDLVMGNVMDVAERRGYQGDVLKAYQEARLSPIVTTLTKKLLEAGGTKDALAYMEVARPYMTAKDLGQLDSLLKVRTDQETATKVIEAEVVPFLGGEKNAIPRPEIIQNLMQSPALVGNPEAMKYALAQADHLMNSQEHAWTQQTHQAVGSVALVKLEKGPMAALQSREFADLKRVDPEAASRAEDHLLSLIKRDDKEGKKLTPEEQFDADATYGEYAFSENLPNFTEADIRAVSISLPNEMGRNLHSLWMKSRTDLGKYQMKTDNNGLFMVARDNGLIKGDKPKGKTENARVQTLKAVAEALAPEQKVVWTDKNQQAFYTKLINTQIKTGENAKVLGFFEGKEVVLPLYEAYHQVPDWFIKKAKESSPGATPDFIATAFQKAKKAGILQAPEGQPSQRPAPVVADEPSTPEATSQPVRISPLDRSPESKAKRREAAKQDIKAVGGALKSVFDSFKSSDYQEGG